MKTSPKGIAIIEHFEGFHPEAYRNRRGDICIGYNSKHNYDGSKFKIGDKITKKEAENLLMYDLEFVEKRVSSHFRMLNQDQFDAVISFVYSNGLGNLLISNLRRKILNNVKDPDIYNEWVKWSYDGKIKIEELIRRRKTEYRLFSTGDLIFYEKKKED